MLTFGVPAPSWSSYLSLYREQKTLFLGWNCYPNTIYLYTHMAINFRLRLLTIIWNSVQTSGSDENSPHPTIRTALLLFLLIFHSLSCFLFFSCFPSIKAKHSCTLLHTLTRLPSSGKSTVNSSQAFDMLASSSNYLTSQLEISPQTQHNYKKNEKERSNYKL